MLQSTGTPDQIQAFREDASAANALARQTVLDEGFDPGLAHQVDI